MHCSYQIIDIEGNVQHSNLLIILKRLMHNIHAAVICKCKISTSARSYVNKPICNVRIDFVLYLYMYVCTSTSKAWLPYRVAFEYLKCIRILLRLCNQSLYSDSLIMSFKNPRFLGSSLSVGQAAFNSFFVATDCTPTAKF